MKKKSERKNQQLGEFRLFDGVRFTDYYVVVRREGRNLNTRQRII